MPIRITGLNSGLDTETIISALVSSYNYKTEKYKKAQTKVSWKQDAWKTLNSKIYSLYNSVGNLRFSTAYNLKSTKCSDTTKASVTAGSSAPNGTQTLNVIKTAQAGYLTGGQLDDNTTTGTTLAELGYTGGDGEVTLTLGNGTSKTISVSQGTTVNDFINSLKDAGVNANYDSTNKRIYVSSKETGLDNDFTLIGSDVDGANALSKLGLNVQSAASDATYQTYTQYYAANGTQDDEAQIRANIVDALAEYTDAKAAYDTKTAQNANMSAAYGYASAYSSMMDTLSGSGLNVAEQEKIRTLLAMSAKERTSSVMDADGNVYKEKATDKNGNKIYSHTDENGNEKLIQCVGTDYYEVTASEQDSGKKKYLDADGNEYTENDDGTFAGKGGKNYRLDGTSLIEVDKNGADVANAAAIATVSSEAIMETVYTQTTGTVLSGVKNSSDVLTDLKTAANFDNDTVTALTKDITTVNTYENTKDTVLADTDAYSRQTIISNIKDAYTNGGTSAVNSFVNNFAGAIGANKTDIAAAETTMEQHNILSKIAAMADGADKEAAIDDFVQKVCSANEIMTSASYNTDAKKIDGRDAVIKLNGVQYQNNTNVFSINGLSITALAETGDGEQNAISITTGTDTQGIYDKIKDFLTQYNSIINEITSLYNADSAKGYEPLSDEEKDAMSETEIEKWEEKIKASLLRRDDSLESVMNAMISSMSKGIKIDGKNYYLSNFGIQTLGFLNAPKNQQNAYHIDGDEDDATVSGKQDKLMAAITADPDTVISFMQQLANNLYTAVGDKMKSTTLSSVYTVYNDKEMASEYSDYTDLIKKWEEKLTQKEDYYYKQFAAMETALSKLNSQTSSLTGLFGSM